MSERPLSRRGLLWLIGPGVLVAATGVGAGDLATAAFAGSALGYGVLWVVVLGAALKFVLNENLARWQMATGETILEGALRRLGRIAQILFFVYLIPWSFFTGASLMSACGITLQGMLPVFDDPGLGKTVFGSLCSIVGLAFVWLGGFKMFERLMMLCIGIMFVAVIGAAIISAPDWSLVARGLVVPTIPDFSGDGRTWAIALMGGVGGTLTIICYSYWMRETGREDASDLKRCRLDLLLAYGMTAIFGISMIIVARDVTLTGGGARLIVELADRLDEISGPVVRWVFLVGAFGAVFSSLLGVWQAVPYVFADFVGIVTDRRTPIDRSNRFYRGFMLAIAIVPAAGLLMNFRQAQLFYTIFGALFVPALAAVLLILNRRAEVGALRNRTASTLTLAVCLLLLCGVAADAIVRKLSG